MAEEPNPQEDPGESKDDPGWLKSLRKKARDYDKLVNENHELKKTQVVKDVGLDPDNNPLHKLLVDNYTGEWNVDSVKEVAETYGLLENSEETGEAAQQLSEDEKVEAGALQRIQQAQQGHGGAPPKAEPEWKQATSEREFLQKYDGPISS